MKEAAAGRGDTALPGRWVRSGDFWAGTALAVLGAYIVVTARGWDYSGPDGPGPGFFPLWYGLAMVALSLGLVLQSVRARRAEQAIAWPDVGRALLCWAAFMVAVLLLKPAGFIPSFGALVWFIAAVMFRKPQRIAIPLAAVGALLFTLVFDYGLGVSLPRGPWS